MALNQFLFIASISLGQPQKKTNKKQKITPTASNQTTEPSEIKDPQ